MHKNNKITRLIAFLFMGVVLLASAVKPVSAGPAAEPSLQDKNGERRGYHPQTGMLSFLGADPANPIQVTSAMLPGLTMGARADAIISTYGPEFGIQDPAQELVVSRQAVSEVNANEIVRYQQVYQGVPILGGELVLNMAETGELVSMSGEISPNLTLSVEPTFSAEQARETALAQVAKYHGLDVASLSATEPELWIYDQRLLMPSSGWPVQLVWRMEVTSSAAPVSQLILVEAHSGKVSLSFNQIDTAWVGSGISRPPSIASAPPATQASVGALTLGTPVLETYDLNSSSVLPGSLVCSNNSRDCSSGITDAVLAHAYAYDTYMAYANNHSRDSIDGAGMAIVSSVRYCDIYTCPYENAYWDGTQMVYGAGFSAADDVVGHELTHGVTQYESNLFYWYQSGAINESFSDIWGEYVDQTNGQGTDTPAVKWLMGEDVPGLGAIRNMKNPGAFGDPDSITSPKYYEGTNDNGGVHFNSGVNNKAAFLMVDGGVFGGKTVTALGWTKTLAVYYYAQANLLTSASDYLDLYNGLYQACLVLVGGAEGITSANCQDVRDATDAVKMNSQPAPNFNPDALYCPANTSAYPNLFEEDFETGTDGWTFEAAPLNTAANWSLWTDSPWFPYLGNYATSGSDSLYADDDASLYTNNDSYAISPSINLPANVKPYLHFRHAYGFEFTGSTLWDGGILEYSVDGGQWTDAAPLYSAGQNYKGTLNNASGNPLGGKKAFGNFSHGYVDSRYNLTSLADHNVRFRWRMGTDSSYSAWGWWLDDVRVEACISIPTVPALLSPANNALITDYTPVLDWKDSTSDLSYYQLQVDDNNDFLSPHLDITVTPSQWEILPGNILNSSTKYYWRVKAFNAGGEAGNWSAVRYFRTAALPPANLIAPADLSVLPERRPIFSWDAAPGATSYTLVVSKEADFTPLALNKTVTTNSYVSTADLAADTHYFWRVRTAAPNGPSDWTDVWEFTTGNPPSVPVLLSPANNALVTDYTPLLDWKPSTPAPGSGNVIDHYEVQVDDDSGFTSPDTYNPAADLVEALTPLNPGVQYYWRVRAYNNEGEYSAWSLVRYFRTTILPPANLIAPADLSILPERRPIYTWDAVAGATSYTLQVSKEADFTPLALNKTVTTNSYVSTADLAADTHYFWRVRTAAPNGPSDWTDVWEFTTGNPPSVPVLLSPANNALVTDYTPLLDWKPSTPAPIDHYEIEVDDDGSFLSPDTYNSVTDLVEATTTLNPGTKYYWRVRAYNTDGEYSAWSLVRYFRTVFMPPALISPADNAALLNLRPLFDWTPVTGASNYTLQVSKEFDFSPLVLNKIVTTDSYTPTANLPAGVPLYWRVRANGAYGPSAYSGYFTVTVSSLSGDDDGDGLPNDWEINGYDANGDTIIDIDLPALGANYRHKDLFVEMDYMANNCGGDHSAYGLAPNNTVINAIGNVFANAPVTNPDGANGINIHLELDDLVPCDADLNPYYSDFIAIKNAYFDPNRTAVYHYMIWANAYNGGTSSGFSFGIPSVDFIVTLGSWGNGGGTDPQKIGTFIHELGHNLGLTHGGSGHENYKPNYLSVMNYFYQTWGVYRNGHWGDESSLYYDRFDYQRFSIPNLAETALKEGLGLNSADANADGYAVMYHCAGTSTWDSGPSSAIDWNCDGDTLDTVNGDVNNTGTKSTLVSQNNWANIDFSGYGVIGSSLSPEELAILSLSNPVIEVNELTLEMQQEFDSQR